MSDRMIRNSITVLSLLFIAAIGSVAQLSRLQPQWWFGGAVGANINFHSTDVKNFNASNTSPVSFTAASGVGLYLSPLLEYRPDPMWGGMLQLGFDSRNGTFDNTTAGSLSTTMNYLTLEPSVRFTPIESGFHFFAGPRIGFSIAKTFTYTPSGGSEAKGDWSGTRGVAAGAQLGAGYDIDISSTGSDWRTNLTPFVAFHFGQGPRSEESWSLTTLRLGLAIKFASASEAARRAEREIQFSVRAPRIIPTERKVKETFPIRNYVFFDEGSTKIPGRYSILSGDEATRFREEKLLEPEPKDLTGRSRRQMEVYRNVLNILGDRMRSDKRAAVTLLGSSGKGSAEGRQLATSIKEYLSDAYGIEPDRISVEGRERPPIPSSAPGGTRELELVQPEDRRVEISSPTASLLDPVQIISLQEDPLDSDVLINMGGAEDLLSSWSVEATDGNGTMKRYGPFTHDQERISGRTILGGNMQGTYALAVVGETKSGQSFRKEETIRLLKSDLPEEEPGFRFSILFEFDQSKTVATYERFLTGTVAPLIPEGGSVIIHGHTDVVGEESHNLSLSRSRAEEAMRIFERELSRTGKKRVKFDAYGFGEDVRRAPFDNRFPEERFYNRTVIIDIVPE